MSANLLAISLGPVQDFISAARKTRDLWFGSAMLSDVARAAALALQKAGAQLIFPSPAALDAEAAVANKLLAIVGGDPSVLSETVRRAANDRLRSFAEDALKRQGNLIVDRELLSEQVTDFLEFYAAWVPYTPASYAQARRAVEQLLAGRKALRDFRPASGRDRIAKSSLDPSRESVLDWRGWPGSVQPPAGTRKNEQLDGISLIKRLAPRQRFVSVSRIAVDPLIRRLQATQSATLAHLVQLAGALEETGAVERFQGFPQFSDFPFDTELFYGEDERVPPAQESTAREFRVVLRGALKEQRISEPPAYYAVLQADGDRMGELIGQCDTLEEHRRLSDQLVAFARSVGYIVQLHHGALVYSGGDDVLAFLPLDRALDCADALRQEFARCIAELPGRRGTLTAGVAFVHYQEPLTEALRWGHEAEQAGKQQRNALAVSVHTRSGGQATRVTGSWEEDPVGQRWSGWVDLHRADALPDAAARDLRRLATELAPLVDRVDVAPLARQEASRILGRKRAAAGTQALGPEIRERLLKRLGGDGPVLEAISNLTSELIIAQRIARVVEIAEGRQ